MRIPTRKIRAALLIPFFGATLLCAGVLLTLNKHVKTVNVAEQSDPLWITSQLQFEFLRLKESINNYAFGEVSPADVELRFNIAWSRIDVIMSGRMSVLTDELNVDNAPIHALKTTFEQLEPEILAFPPSEASLAERSQAARAVIGQLNAHDLELRDFSLELAQSKARLMADFRTVVVSLSHEIAYLLLLIFLLVVIFIAFLGLELQESRATAKNMELLARQAESASEAKDKFMSAVSHELRTPLTSILGGIQLLRAAYRDALDEKAFKIVEIAQRNCERLLALVNDILDAQSILAGKVHLNKEAMDLNTLVESAVEDCQAYASRLDVAYEFDRKDRELFAVVDQGRITQVLTNLLSNAAKFTSKGDKIRVRAEETGDWIKVEVQDHGRGIPESEFPNIFTRFHQVSPGESGSTKSSGLGLSISKQLIEMHGGQIGFESVLGRGSTFWFKLKKGRKPQNCPETKPQKVLKAANA